MADEMTRLRERWGEDDATRMTLLCRSFPTLREADGVEPWDPHGFLSWLASPEAGRAAHHAALSWD